MLPGGFLPPAGGSGPMTDTLLYVALVAGLAAVARAAFYARRVLATPQGNERMVELASAIREGAMAVLRREYAWGAVLVAVMALLSALLLEDGGQRALA